ncbi:MAG TPA: Stp1/IreP family PP2C-type Ser/Thr phosphatase [Clostridiaceae bacterium]|jgi:protein phosphatase|nr:Stp1/IreP family PP2C-type Ser/Thr phosphatase [Clostridiaceae bacterium]HHY25105.1 Stp1/IreP family PP2C-type Ser/Thr phosphatase [Clostridiaceae bacterium]
MLENLHYAAMSRKGPNRKVNEDNFVIVSREKTFPVILAVADGMGGHLNGELASKTAVDGIRELLLPLLPERDDNATVMQVLEDTIQTINIDIYKKSLESKNNSGMGTTLTCAVFYPGVLYLCQIGDSRCYVFRSGQLEQLTRDHTLVQEMLDLGEIEPQEARFHARRHILTQALGAPDYVRPDVTSHELGHHDRYLICSDGLHGYVPDEDIMWVIKNSLTAREAAEKLVDIAHASGGSDDVTVILVFRGIGESNAQE